MRRVTLEDFRRFIGGQVRNVDHGPPGRRNNVLQGLLVDIDPGSEKPLRFEWLARFHDVEGEWRLEDSHLGFVSDAEVAEERPDGCLVLKLRHMYLNEDTYLFPKGHPECLVVSMVVTGNRPTNHRIMAA